ncbi:hypothetical protein Q5752_002981 [Cryptotrichosporon argae]
MEVIPDVAAEKRLFAGQASEGEMQARLAAVRREITDSKLDYYVVPSENEHQSEDIADSDKRREWVSGFDGSAGVALIPASSEPALLFVDSRYWILAEAAVPKANWKVVRVGSTGEGGKGDVVGGWVEYAKSLHGRIGIDPRLITNELANNIRTQVALIRTPDLIDRARPPPPRSSAPFVPYPLLYAGESTSSKLARLRPLLAADIYLLPTLPAIAWLLDVRADDIPFCHVGLAYVAVTQDSCVAFVDESKVGDELRETWSDAGVEIRRYGVEEVAKYVKEYAEALGRKKVMIKASAESSWALVSACTPHDVQTVPCPVDAAKALKNDVELQGFRNAYLRDGVAMVRWLAWLEQKIVKEKKDLGEWTAAQMLNKIRARDPLFRGLAYGDISVTGPHGASGHYMPTRENQSPIDLVTPYTIDSGPQYLDATIDTTRSFFFGKSPSDDIKRAYTRVLQAHFAVATATFPLHTDAAGLAALAKDRMYRDGLDFGHGLGHGVGNYLAVHESPVSFRKGFQFQPGHVTSIEPGFYLEDNWGMRIESVYICKRVETRYEYGGARWLGFERVTQVPIDMRMVDYALMTKGEIRWLNDHNTDVQNTLLPLLDTDADGAARDWVKKACKPKRIWPWTGV